MKLFCKVLIVLFVLVLVSCATTGQTDLTYELILDEISKPEYLSSNKNTWNLRDNAGFELEVSDGVYWVPANYLGKTRYSNEQIAQMVYAKPEIKKQLIGNLYEAIQLYQISGFSGNHDNIRNEANGISWEYHKPGYYAVLTNNGCCATSCNWLFYLLNGKYDELGILQISETNGSGHVINYIKQEDYYYFVDLTHYRNDNTSSAIEDGNYDSYRSVDFVLGNIHKTTDPMLYVNYYMTNCNDQLALFAIYPNHEVLNIGSVFQNDRIELFYDYSFKKVVKVLYDNPDDKLTLDFVPDNSTRPHWGFSKKIPYEITTKFKVEPLVVLKRDYDTIPKNSGFGSGHNNVFTVYVYRDDQLCTDYTFEIENSVGDIEKKEDGGLRLKGYIDGRSKITIFVDGYSFDFYWRGY